jgi:sulfide:quinone oxidoreductase
MPIDTRCRVAETDGRVFAAGDATDFPIKHGGIASQQADTAAAGIAHLAGAAEPPPPFEPVIRGMLLTGRKPLYLAAHVVEGRGWHSEIYEQPPWPSEEKVIAEELGPYLRSREAAVPRP